MSNDRAGSEDENLDAPTGAEQAAEDSSVEAADDAAGAVSSDGASADNDGIGERDFAPELDDSDDEDSDVSLEKVGVGAAGAGAAAGSARAAARRAGARSGVTEGKGAATRARGEKDEHLNPVARLGRFLREVIAELGKVIWPSQKQMVTYTIVVIFFLIFMIALVSGLDLLFGWGVRSIFG